MAYGSGLYPILAADAHNAHKQHGTDSATIMSTNTPDDPTPPTPTEGPDTEGAVVLETPSSSDDGSVANNPTDPSFESSSSSRLETSIPYRGFGNDDPHDDPSPPQASSEAPLLSSSSSSAVPSKAKEGQHNNNKPQQKQRLSIVSALGRRLRAFFFHPADTDFQRVLDRLEEQFWTLDGAYERYNRRIKTTAADNEGKDDTKYEDSKEDPDHPINAHSSNLITDVHFAGRSMTDPSLIKLSTLLIDHDRYGCILELWLNNNDISDEGSAAIASYLELSSCALVELWLGRNRIGPGGVAAIAAALDTNGHGSKLKCLGLQLNPIGNRGASSLARMLKGNHTLTTVDVHGCLYYEGRDGDDEIGIAEEYAGGCGCKAITPYDGNEYLARIIANDNRVKGEAGLVTDWRYMDAIHVSSKISGGGFVTDGRYTDVIHVFSTFNRKNLTREQAIRGMTPSKERGGGVSSSEGDNNEEQGGGDIASTFLSELRGKPSDERLTDDEKCRW
eukprot:CAMPEP_0181125136 /NCGR_PEP_ID=MMETSP1071-20121207/26873_1 /TAXON_ID=35127 /ORGANISM="Thalassiosira sp., Strain NH16" /LENGTH=503 /DNA_ID=CAMNT_0023210527 /DNA_START=93 /DNA_END=1601 /DNA_ORIENTATION=-